MRTRFKSFLVLLLCLIIVFTGCKRTSADEAVQTNPDTGETIETTEGNADNNNGDEDDQTKETSGQGEAAGDDESGGNNESQSGDADSNGDKDSTGDKDNTGNNQDNGNSGDNGSSGSNGNNSGNSGSSGNSGNSGNSGSSGNSGNSGNDRPDFDTSKTVFNIDEDVLPYTQEEIYTQLFDINNKVEIDIDISNSELAKMQADYEEYANMGSKSPIYRKASVDIKITTSKDSYTYHIDEVGIRMKGNTSRTSFYNKDEGKYNLIHFKLDFQETFDDEDYYKSAAKDWGTDETARDARKDRTFATLEKIDVKWNRNDDTTYIREYYAYETYRANGVLAPHTNIASVDVAGTHEGVFIFYEPIDKIFIEKYVDEADQGGDLYKCGWTYNGANFLTNCSIGVEDEDNAEFYNYDLKTNKKTSQNTQLKNLISVLNGGDLDKSTIESIVDMDNFLKYEAVSYFVGNPDDMRNNYNNYYIYFLKSSGKMIVIPYDMDRCFGITKGWNPNGNGMSDVNPFSKNAEGANTKQANPLYIYTVDEGGYFVSEFADVLKEVSASEWLTTAKFNAVYNTAYNNYKNDTTPGREFYNAGGYRFSFNNGSTGSLSSGDNASFADYITAKMNSYNKYIAKKDDYASSITVQPYYIRGSFTGWNVDERYLMSYDSNAKVYTYTLTLNSTESFKINNGVDGEPGIWYGQEEVISSGTTIQTDDYDNIILTKGTYTITFSSKDKTIIIK